MSVSASLGRRSRLTAVFVCVLLLLGFLADRTAFGAGTPPGAAAAASYYVDPVNGSSANPGTSAQPWKSFQDIFAQGRTYGSGDVVYLRSGNYGAAVVNGGVSSGNRTIKAAPGAVPRMKTLRFAAGATHWTVDGVLVSPQEARRHVHHRQPRAVRLRCDQRHPPELTGPRGQ
ncbi:hypothetical protein GTZ89_10750 [Streptomyces sp. SID8382]|uniref:hypothetical protein n=1 Tax=Streptomyces malaysiensis TaxID=92644 RepID=UPI001331B0DC|nr:MULTISPECIES: hypothetical protein [unclassified Streptomyces]MYX56171.1 hypothetical protein [Streptomyces sp. SID8382]